jgi:hypothetical protein
MNEYLLFSQKNLFIFLHAFEEQEHEGRDRGTKSRLSATFTI